MSEQVTHIDRKSLYERVWSTPMLHLAKEFGVSDSGLAKICQRHQIPRPAAGYWAKLKHGQAPKKPPLPKPKDTTELVVLIRKTEKRQYIKSDLPVPDAKVVEVLEHPHRLVASARRHLKRGRKSETGILSPKARRVLDIRVGADQQDRALLLMDAVIKAIEAQGWKVVLAQKEADHQHFENAPWYTFALVDGEKTRFSISERLKRLPHELTERERQDKKRWKYFSAQKYDYVPSGVLVLQVHDVRGYDVRQRWEDKKRTKLEDNVGAFVINLDAVAKGNKQVRERHRRWEIERRREEQERWDRERRARYDQALGKDMERMSSDWSKACQLGAFLAMADEALPAATRGEGEKIWFDWAQDYVWRLDPLSDPDSIPKVVDLDQLPLR
jgi:hypothetical protein